LAYFSSGPPLNQPFFFPSHHGIISRAVSSPFLLNEEEKFLSPRFFLPSRVFLPPPRFSPCHILHGTLSSPLFHPLDPSPPSTTIISSSLSSSLTAFFFFFFFFSSETNPSFLQSGTYSYSSFFSLFCTNKSPIPRSISYFRHKMAAGFPLPLGNMSIYFLFRPFLADRGFTCFTPFPPSPLPPNGSLGRGIGSKGFLVMARVLPRSATV